MILVPEDPRSRWKMMNLKLLIECISSGVKLPSHVRWTDLEGRFLVTRLVRLHRAVEAVRVVVRGAVVVDARAHRTSPPVDVGALVQRADGAVHGQLLVVGADPVPLGVPVGKQPRLMTVIRHCIKKRKKNKTKNKEPYQNTADLYNHGFLFYQMENSDSTL